MTISTWLTDANRPFAHDTTFTMTDGSTGAQPARSIRTFVVG
ncbi:hypothetical protein [Myceligenerans indicum]|nr:hypothetical protein [Myceligenerans indicum]